MPFSPQTYQGQGIVQQNVTPRAGEIIGQSLANFGQSIGSGIAANQERKEALKRQAGAADGMRKSLINLGLLEKDEATSMGFNELMAFSEAAPQMLAQKREQQRGDFFSRYYGAQQPQQVTEQVDFAPQVAEAQSSLDQAIAANQFKPEFKFKQPLSVDKTQGLQMPPAMAGTNAPQLRSILPQDGTARPAPLLSTLETIGAVPPKPVGPQAGPEPMPEEPAEITQLRDKLAAIQIQAAEGDTQTRQESPEEYQSRIQSFLVEELKNNPIAAEFLVSQMTGQKLTPSEQLAITKHQREVAASTVPGYGDAGNPQIAKEFRQLVSDGNDAHRLLGQLIDIGNKPGSKFSLHWRKLAQNIALNTKAKLRTQLVGVGAVNESEWKMLDDIIANPTKWTNLKGPTLTSLKKLQDDIKIGIDAKADTINWIGGRQNAPTAAGPKRISYDAKGNPVTQ